MLPGISHSSMKRNVLPVIFSQFICKAFQYIYKALQRQWILTMCRINFLYLLPFFRLA